MEKFLKSVEELGKLKDESASPIPPVPKSKVKDQRTSQPEADMTISSTDFKNRLKSPRKLNLSSRQSMSPDELNIR